MVGRAASRCSLHNLNEGGQNSCMMWLALGGMGLEAGRRNPMWMGHGANTNHRGQSKLDLKDEKQVGRGHHAQLPCGKVELDGFLHNRGKSLCIFHANLVSMPPLVLRMIRRGFCLWECRNTDHTHCHSKGVMVEIVMVVSTSAPDDGSDPNDVGN